MTPVRRKRLLFVAVLVLGVGAATALALKAFRENLLYFYSPSQVLAGKVPPGAQFRLGGLVEPGSVKRSKDSLTVQFVLADCEHTLAVSFTGILPDLFRERQGIVARGKLNAEGVFVAAEVLAKHDENYMPPEVAQSLQTTAGQSCMPADMSTDSNASKESS
ncbi:MAG: cytochrome c maturation protein CcmE [Nevskiales bacterium]